MGWRSQWGRDVPVGGSARVRPTQRLGDATADFNAQLNAKLSSASGDTQAYISQQTGVNVQNARAQAGAAAAVSLAQHGYDVGNMADNEALVTAIAGGVALIPGVGPVLAVAIETLWQVGKIAACPVQSAFAELGMASLPPSCGGQPCVRSGRAATPFDILSGSALPSMPIGSFASLVIPALATQAAKSDNCQAAFPPSVIVDGIAAIWNQTHAGPPVDYYIPPLNATSPIIPCIGGDLSACASDPHVIYAFQPMSLTPGWSWLAANPVGRDPSSGINYSMFPQEPARILSLNSGALLDPATVSRKIVAIHFGPAVASSTPVATAAKAAAGTAAVVGVGGLAVAAVVAYAKGRTIEYVLGGAWNKIKAIARTT